MAVHPLSADPWSVSRIVRSQSTLQRLLWSEIKKKHSIQVLTYLRVNLELFNLLYNGGWSRRTRNTTSWQYNYEHFLILLFATLQPDIFLLVYLTNIVWLKMIMDKYGNYVRKFMWQLCRWGRVDICMICHRRAFDFFYTITHWLDNFPNS
jgi:hypothetical protein